MRAGTAGSERAPRRLPDAHMKGCRGRRAWTEMSAGETSRWKEPRPGRKSGQMMSDWFLPVWCWSEAEHVSAGGGRGFDGPQRAALGPQARFISGFTIRARSPAAYTRSAHTTMSSSSKWWKAAELLIKHNSDDDWASLLDSDERWISSNVLEVRLSAEI